MNVRTILTNIVSFVTPKMHATRQKALSDCVHSLANGSAATVTSIGRGINSGAYEKHSIKRADRLLSNPHLLREQSLIYGAICRLFCTAKHPTISIDWSDLDECKRHFLLRASLSFDGRAITLYEEVHPLSTKEKPAAHKLFLRRLSLLLPAGCKPVIVTDAGFKTPWFRQIEALGWYFVGRVRKPCFYTTDNGGHWQCISQLYATASQRPKLYQAKIARNTPFACTLTLYKQKAKGRHALNADGSVKSSKTSQSNARANSDPWLLASNLPKTSHHGKNVVAIYRQRMQIEESFRDMKSTQFGLGFEQNYTIKLNRLSILVLLTNLASLALILLGVGVTVAKKHWQFQANTQREKRVLSFHTLGLRAIAKRLKLTAKQWRDTLKHCIHLLDTTSYSII
ncbi:transposase, IS4 family [Arsukibacterium tuosuense]|uniref:Transposase, IS4 family n=1 Tax=Arsukibacterium tuosuense TaxID=1323745 RepID=A0A285JLL1_9GAMM|nr:IS4 family transposase [Arsukibacterium tuosuense]SNY61148.1 transposase, IS4 family [Arsukibacterium tuosuense]